MTKNSPAKTSEGRLQEQQITERYTLEELEFLFHTVRCYPHIIESPLSNAETKRRKNIIWNWIARAVHDKFKPTTGKSASQLRNWWKRTKNRARKRLEHTELNISETQIGLPNRNRGYLEHIFREICEFSNQISMLYSPELEDLDFKNFLTTLNAQEPGTPVDLVIDGGKDVGNSATGVEHERAADTKGFQIVDNRKRDLEVEQVVQGQPSFLCEHELNNTHFGLLDFTHQTGFQQMVATAFWKLVSTLSPTTPMSSTENAIKNSKDLLTGTSREEERESLVNPQLPGSILKEQLQTSLTSPSMRFRETQDPTKAITDNCSVISSDYVHSKRAPQGPQNDETRMNEDVDKLREQVFLLKRRKLELQIKLLEKQLL
ncbi:unnamed protein product [Schistocephalus solidus]|uniref:Myb_DNA-bind_5 domain-containing protein n=1 Tax=Schistocephalus solidus TaxID=70667 RepID=A0A183SZT5_SCHSO|nr:unnamed protein product [Schistocephalus solidus]